jgi:hypothetical protein
MQVKAQSENRSQDVTGIQTFFTLMTHLFGPRSFHQLRIDDLLPALLTLDIGAVWEVERDNVPSLIVILYQLFQPCILQPNLQLLFCS